MTLDGTLTQPLALSLTLTLTLT